MQDRTELLFDYVETARRLSVGRSTVYVLVAAGELDTVKIGRRSLITAASLYAYVERLTGAGAGVEMVGGTEVLATTAGTGTMYTRRHRPRTPTQPSPRLSTTEGG